MGQRYFRSDEATYEAVRAQLDTAWGHPNAFAATCIEPAATAPHDASSMVVLAVNEEFCGYPAVAAVLPGLLASGAVQEITADEYRASVAPDPEPA